MLWKSHQAKAVPKGKLTVLAQFIKKEEEGLKSKELRIHLRKLEKEQEKKAISHNLYLSQRELTCWRSKKDCTLFTYLFINGLF